MTEKLQGENRVFSENLLLSRKEIYQDTAYITLYRYENKNVPYDESREGVVSKKILVGAWFCDSIEDLKTYFIQRVQGVAGGSFVTIRVKRAELARYDATSHPETQDMDVEAGNYVIPAEVIAKTGLYIEAPFKDAWEGKKNVPMKDWRFITDFLESKLSDQALVLALK